MNKTQKEFVNLLIKKNALKFGDFTLKSGRKSPYFINTGSLFLASDLEKLGTVYAEKIMETFKDVDIIFGPAYKGIPLALAASTAYYKLSGKDIAWSYDRKEVKDHGDGGSFVGAELNNKLKVVIVDDVLTAGTALRESFDKLKRCDVEILGAVISVDRMEKGKSDKKAIQEISDDYNIPVYAITNMLDIAEYLETETIEGISVEQKIVDAIKERVL